MTNEQKQEIGKIMNALIRTIRTLNNEGEEINYKYEDLPPEHLELLNQTIEDVESGKAGNAQEEHYKWMCNKLMQGYKYGVVKSDINKTHNCLVPYEELNFLQKLKDHIFISVVNFYIKEVVCFDNSKNQEILKESIDQLNNGQGKKQELIEEGDY